MMPSEPRSGHFETRYSRRGYPLQMWVRDMPRLDERYLNCVVYLYPCEDAAEKGERIGGTGFLIGSPVANLDHQVVTTFLCLVTNKHVAEAGNSVVRSNTKSGKMDTFTLDERNWIYHPAGDDLAVYPLGLAPLHPYPYMDAGGLNCVTRSSIEGLDIGIGDEVFTVGRFIGREGAKINIPALRFGNISQMPVEPILMDDGFRQDCFLVEVRSLSGYSGSPVFLYVPPQARLERYSADAQESLFQQFPMLRRKRRNMDFGFGPILLGVSFCYFGDRERVRTGATDKPMHDWYVRSNSGMMGVIPGWKLNDLILGTELMKITDEIGKDLFEVSKKSGVTLTSATEQEGDSSSDANPTHQEDFTRLVGVAARKPPQAD